MRKENMTYYFSVEGETEKWYLDWLRNCINECDEAKYKVKLKTSVIMLLQENVFTPIEFMDELSCSYGLSISAKEAEYLLDLPVGTLANPKIIAFPSLQIRRNNN